MSDALNAVVTMKLRKPITVHGDNGHKEVNELTLKLPSGRTVLRLGEPFTLKIENDSQGAQKIEFKIIPPLATEYLAEMSGVDALLLGQMHPHDVLDAFNHLTQMLRPTQA